MAALLSIQPNREKKKLGDKSLYPELMGSTAKSRNSQLTFIEKEDNLKK